MLLTSDMNSFLIIRVNKEGETNEIITFLKVGKLKEHFNRQHFLELIYIRLLPI